MVFILFKFNKYLNQSWWPDSLLYNSHQVELLRKRSKIVPIHVSTLLQHTRECLALYHPLSSHRALLTTVRHFVNLLRAIPELLPGQTFNLGGRRAELLRTPLWSSLLLCTLYSAIHSPLTQTPSPPPPPSSRSCPYRRWSLVGQSKWPINRYDQIHHDRRPKWAPSVGWIWEPILIYLAHSLDYLSGAGTDQRGQSSTYFFLRQLLIPVLGRHPLPRIRTRCMRRSTSVHKAIFSLY